ncbi:Aldo-keto reductase YhdN [bioreactor metagenome]|uniref:Aldo-keto reductase YhdN n=1 Tax=bioreactor metagenome TaxID=1076179 RepID=A0A645BHT8_9ZZZZ
MNFNKKIADKMVNPLGIGTWMIGGGIYLESKTTYATYGNEEEEVKAIRYSIAQGQNHIDTAQMYGAGHTEEVVGQAIEGLDRNKLFIASKVWKSHATRLAVPHAIQDMLKRMRTDYLDLVYIHAPFPELEMEEYIHGLNDALDQGLIKNIGVSNFTFDQLKQAVSLSKHPISALQNHFNLLYKAEFPADLRRYCITNNIAMVAYRPLGRKLLADECQNEVLLNMAKKYGKTPAQVALNWLISQNGFYAIPKALKLEDIKENMAALEFEISQDDLEILNMLPDETQK